VNYRVYCREMTVDTNFVDSEMATLNGAGTFITPVNRTGLTYDVLLELPDGWKESRTALRAHPDGRPHHYRAPDYDTLVDSPIVAGNPVVYPFTVDGKRHELVNLGNSAFFGAQAAKDVEAIVRENLRMWGFLPYDHYLFLNIVSEAGGGLEHKESTMMMTRAFAPRTRASYIRWLGLVSHEYFHAWNVKRLRPLALGPFDYEHENYVGDLWISEGFTSYFGALNLHRAKLTTDEEYLESLSNTIENLQTTAGRLVLPVSESSFDAWIRQYRANENSPNSAISYYTKGEVIGLLLDSHIRSLTKGAKSLDDVMKLAYQRYSGARGFTSDDFRRAASDVAGVDLAPWFRKAVDSTEELDYKEMLEVLGLRFQAKKEDSKEDGKKEPKGWLGASTRNDAGRLLVTQVRKGTPAYEAGLGVDDEILAIDDYRVPADGLDARLENYRPGERVTLLVARRLRLTKIPVVLGAEPPKQWRLEIDPKATDAQ
jgi:predicted metalloprotease with PDZ domain